MRPLQDQCEPTPYEDIEKLFLSDMGKPISEIFEEFDPQPLGVASLAQVHKGRLKETGEVVAVKVRPTFSLYATTCLTCTRFNIPTCRSSVI